MSDKLPDNGGYVAAAYLVFLGLLLVYFAIMATRSARFERDLSEVNRLLDEATDGDPGSDAPDPAATIPTSVDA